MVRINIKLDKRTRKDGKAALKVALAADGKTLYAPLGIAIDPEDWSNEAQAILGTRNRAINALVQRKRAEMDARFADLQKRGAVRAMQPRRLLAYIMGEDEASRPRYFIDSLRAYINNKPNPRTRAIYADTEAKLARYCRVEDLTFDDINVAWLRSFDAWMAKDGLSVNARSIHLRNIRAVFNMAIDDELITTYPFRRFKIQSGETPHRAIRVEDMRRLMRAEIAPFQERYRDAFFLTFYLIGINTVDLSRLTEITAGRINYERAKTHKNYSIKVESEAMAIIERWRGERALLSWFDNRTNYRTFASRMDGNLQRIARANGLPPITSYVARHSWATYASELDIPKDIIAHALGHHTDVTDVYIKFNPAKVDEANRRVIDYLFGK